MKECLSCGNCFESPGWECPLCHYKPKDKKGHLLFAPESAEKNTGFDASYFSKLASAEDRNFWFRARNKLVIWSLERFFPNAKNLLEIGCGTGFVLSGIARGFPQLSLYGSEIYSDGLTYASERLTKAKLFQMDARKIPFNNEFDVIGAFDVLEHIEDDNLVLAQMYKAVRKGGGIILTVPQHRFLWSKVDESACHVRRYEAKELKDKAERAGFKVVKAVSFVSLLLPLMAASRLMKCKDSSESDNMPEIEINGFMNTVLEKILDIERGLIRLGIHLPFGGSLLLIAKKGY